MIEPSTHWAVEGLDQYRPGGYHPVHLGDKFKDQYVIMRKLAHGYVGTVWGVKDLINNRYLALKILRSDNTQDAAELEILRHLHACSRSSAHAGAKHVVTVLDSFHHQGPNGRHLCLIFPLMGVDLQTLLDSLRSRQHSPTIAKEICRQIGYGLDFIHSSGVVHGDLKLDNILVSMNQTDIEMDMLAPVEIKWLDHTQNNPNVPSYLIKPRDMLSRSLLVRDGSSIEVKIADFGGSSWIETETSERPVVLKALRAPELVHGSPWNEKIDIWTLGCLFFEICHGRPLFDLQESAHTDTTFDKAHKEQIEMVIMPGTDRHVATARFAFEMSKATNRRLTVGDLELARLLMDSMLVMDAKNRASMTEAINDPWFSASTEDISIQEVPSIA